MDHDADLCGAQLVGPLVVLVCHGCGYVNPGVLPTGNYPREHFVPPDDDSDLGSMCGPVLPE